jgi:hypothetical protein
MRYDRSAGRCAPGHVRQRSHTCCGGRSPLPPAWALEAATSRPDGGTEGLSSERSKSEPCKNSAVATIAGQVRSAEREKYVARYLNLWSELPRRLSDAVCCTPTHEWMNRVSNAATGPRHRHGECM